MEVGVEAMGRREDIREAKLTKNVWKKKTYGNPPLSK